MMRKIRNSEEVVQYVTEIDSNDDEITIGVDENNVVRTIEFMHDDGSWGALYITTRDKIVLYAGMEGTMWRVGEDLYTFIDAAYEAAMEG